MRAKSLPEERTDGWHAGKKQETASGRVGLGIEELAAAKGCTPSHFALAWVLAQGHDIVPIPGTKRVKYLDDNLGAVKVRLSADDLAQLDAILPANALAGARYPAQSMQAIDR